MDHCAEILKGMWSIRYAKLDMGIIRCERE